MSIIAWKSNPGKLIGMKALFLLLGFTALLPSYGAPVPEGQAIQGPTFQGVILTPQILPKPTKEDPFPIVAAVWPQKATYWTPSSDLVRKAEKAFAEAVIAANEKLPPGGPHYRAFYSPKHFSPDRENHLPDDIYTNFFYYFDRSVITPQEKRQYIGVTVEGKKFLVMNLIDNDFTKDMAKGWMYICDGGTQIFYDLQTGQFTEIDT
jgi:hypothetical protein